MNLQTVLGGQSLLHSGTFGTQVARPLTTSQVVPSSHSTAAHEAGWSIGTQAWASPPMSRHSVPGSHSIGKGHSWVGSCTRGTQLAWPLIILQVWPGPHRTAAHVTCTSTGCGSIGTQAWASPNIKYKSCIIILLCLEYNNIVHYFFSWYKPYGKCSHGGLIDPRDTFARGGINKDGPYYRTSSHWYLYYEGCGSSSTGNHWHVPWRMQGWEQWPCSYLAPILACF